MNPLLLALVLAPDATPQATVQAFVDAINAHDPLGMARHVVGGKPIGLGWAGGTPKYFVELGSPRIDGDRATIDSDLSLDPPDPTGPMRYHETLTLRRFAGDWRIVPIPYTPPGDIVLNPIATFVTLVANPRLLDQAHAAAEGTISLSKVEQIAHATLLYAQDHGNALPASKSFKASVMPYLKYGAAFAAPGTPKGSVSYFLDPRLSGLKVTTMPHPAETAMILEGAPSKMVFPYGGETPVGYVDGHVRLIDAGLVLRARRVHLR